jgi:electron transfer flavoprotein beta subunit
MKIVVCIKQVPATHEVSIDPVTKRLIREGVAAEINPFDRYAVEEAVLLRERLGGEVIVLSMGPPQAMDAVREAIACGADRGVLLSDRSFAGSDTWATSYALSSAVRSLGSVDLVLCGKQAVDGDTAQVGPGIAAHLDWPQVTYVAHLEQAGKDELVLRRMNEDGYDRVRVELPAVLTVVKDLNTPRVPTLRSRIVSLKAQVPVLTPADIGADPRRLGLDGSPTRVVRTQPPPGRSKQSVRLEGPAEESARRIVHELRTMSIV